MSEPILLSGLIDRLRGKIDVETWEVVESYHWHGEWGLAIEALCDGLYEAGESLPEDEVWEVREVGNSMRLTCPSFLLLTGQNASG